MQARNFATVCALLGLFLSFCFGCTDLKDKAPLVIPNSAPGVAAIPDQTVYVGSALLLDLASYVSDAQDSDSLLTLSVASGGGFFSGTRYVGQFNVEGLQLVQFAVTDSEGLSTAGSFNVDVVTAMPGNAAPVIGSIGAQSATELSPFSLDLAAFVTDDNDNPADLNFAVISGGGSFTDSTYSNTFAAVGSVTVQFLVMDTGGMSAAGSFDITVGAMANDPPEITSPLPAQTAAVGYTFILDLGPLVNDDNDPDKDLVFEVTSGEGSFIGTVYTALYATTGVRTIGFSVTDTRGLSSADSFDVDAQDGGSANLPPVVDVIPARSATQLTAFSFDVADYVSDEDIDADLVFGVTAGGGTFTGTTYDNTFPSAGAVNVEFVVMDTQGMSSTGSFDVNVAALANDPPVIGPIGDQDVLVGAAFALDLSGVVTDTGDDVEDLAFTVTSAEGSFSGPVFLHSFATEGTRLVDFEVEDTLGAISSSSFTVRAHLAPSADFTADLFVGNAPLEVSFTDLSAGTVTSWAWDFEADGTIDSTAQHPTHIFGAPGIYTVVLTIDTPVGPDTKYMLDCVFVLSSGDEEAVADFTVDTRIGRYPLEVQFTDLTVGLVSNWFWDFDNDGTIDSTAQNPTHTYTAAGRYSARLTVAGDGGFDTKLKDKYIVVVENAWHVDSSVLFTTGDGTTWLQAFQTIQQGLDSAGPTDLVLVADGTYSGASNIDLDFGGDSIYLLGTKYHEPTGICLIDCGGTGRGFYFGSGETEDAVVDGFTITGGSVTDGGGIYCSNSNPTIVNCVITGNSASGYGGGVCTTNGADPVIANSTISANSADYGAGIFMGIACAGTVTACAITGNTATYDGGGIYCLDTSSPVITKCTIANNQANNGAGVYCVNSSSTAVYNCIITNNLAGTNGGGVYTLDCNPSFISCAITNNTASSKDGGGMYIGGTSSPITTNCTIANNVAEDGGGVCCFSVANAAFNNTIIWGNVATSKGNQIYQGTANTRALLKNCNVPSDAQDPDRFDGPGEVLELEDSSVYGDPLFVDAGSPGVGGGGDYLIITGSSCVDAGRNSLVVVGGNTDLAGNLRIVNGIVDIGAYEYQWSP